jgi:hypothetical protein
MLIVTCCHTRVKPIPEEKPKGRGKLSLRFRFACGKVV